MIKEGIVDPTKVTRSAILNASSISALFVTTEAAVTEIKEDKPAAPLPQDGRRHGRHVLIRAVKGWANEDPFSSLISETAFSSFSSFRGKNQN
jgi:hypothetical protein